VITLVEFQYNDEPLLALIAERLVHQSVGLVYFDIAGFSQIEKIYGTQVCEQILRILKQTVTHVTPALITYRLIGDDFFIYTALPHGEQSDVWVVLRSLCKEIQLGAEQTILSELPILKEFNLHVGCDIIHNNQSKHLHYVVYSAMKNTIHQAKTKKVPSLISLERDEFQQILYDKNVSSVYQPIVDLSSGNILGYEALTRGPEGSQFHSPIELFKFAELEDSVYILDRLAREKALNGCQSLESSHKVFINVPSTIINDPMFTPGLTRTLLEQCGIKPHQVVFEITERSSIRDFESMKLVLEHYRSQGYQIAIDDAGAGYSSLQAIAELQPDYIKVDSSLVHGVHKDKIKENILRTFITMAQHMNIRLIAEGIEDHEDLHKIISMGVEYAQGFYLGRPNKELRSIESAIANDIKLHNTLKLKIESPITIGDLVIPMTTFEPNAVISEIAQYLKNKEDSLGVVIVDQNKPIGLLMREKLYRLLAEQYGIALNWNRPVQKIMDQQPLIVEADMPIEQVSQIAMSRDINKLYDIVLVTRMGKFIGVTTIRSILECITNVKMKNARFANPLTGLPGNLQIQHEIQSFLYTQKFFSVIYIDLDEFKSFNDLYGYQRGDELIQYTSEVLKQAVILLGISADFVGHIGGDDFIVITSVTQPEQLCQDIIHEFEKGVARFYNKQMWSEIRGRNGLPLQTKGPTLSLSVIVCNPNLKTEVNSETISNWAAKMKKAAKAQAGNVYNVHILS